MRWALLLVLVLAVSGCERRELTYDYDTVFVRYEVRGGLVPEDRYSTEHVIDNSTVTFTRRYVNGTVSYTRSSNISKEEYVRLGTRVVDAGLFGMLDVYRPSYSSQLADRPQAEIYVNIGGRNKTVRMKPFVEEYMPGNLQMTISEIKRHTQTLQD
ncbi:MAG: hypothetical protein V1875_04640 [Candidatus Altiarchaeota archaeon]